MGRARSDKSSTSDHTPQTANRSVSDKRRPRMRREFEKSNIVFVRTGDTVNKIMALTKGRMRDTTIEIVHMEGGDRESMFTMSKAVGSLLKYGYATLARMKTKQITTRSGNFLSVLVVSLRKSENFKKIDEDF